MLARAVEKQKAPASADDIHRAIERRFPDVVNLERPEAQPGAGEGQETSGRLNSGPSRERSATCTGLSRNRTVVAEIDFIPGNRRQMLRGCGAAYERQSNRQERNSTNQRESHWSSP